MLARASAREREVAVRAALGAGRWRLVRQLMVDLLVLAVTGAVLSIILAWWAVQILRGSRCPTASLAWRPSPSTCGCSAAAAGLSLVTGLLFGIVPALQLSKPDPTRSLKDGTHGAGAGRGRQRLSQRSSSSRRSRSPSCSWSARRLFVRQLHRADAGQSGFQPRSSAHRGSLAPCRAGPPTTRYELPRSQRSSIASAGVPGVVHASMSRGGVPFTPRMWLNNLRVPPGTASRTTLDSASKSQRRSTTERWGFPSGAAGSSTRRTTRAARTP